MRTMVRMTAMVLALAAASTVQAAPAALVEIVQSPAWVERAGKQMPLVAGMVLHNRDRLTTGGNGRVVITFADGSSARLGEQALLVVNAMQTQANGTFAGGLDVRNGDLRLVTHDYREAPARRAINVRFGDVTAAVRSEADITGLSEAPRDAVALRDGTAVLSHPLAGSVELNEPLQVYEVPRGAMPLPIYSIDRFAGATWALKSQPLFDGGTQARDGRWLLSFGVFDRAGALAIYDQLRGDGYPVKIRPLREDGKSRYEVRLTGIATEREAVSLAARLAEQTGLAPAEVSTDRR